VVLEAVPPGGLIKVGARDGMPQIMLAVAPTGGVVETIDNQGKLFRTFAVRANPMMVARVGPPPAPPSDKPAAETPEKPTGETPPATDEPAGEKPSETNDKPTEKSAETNDKPAEKPPQP
jgi:hypothetical protein